MKECVGVFMGKTEGHSKDYILKHKNKKRKKNKKQKNNCRKGRWGCWWRG